VWAGVFYDKPDVRAVALAAGGIAAVALALILLDFALGLTHVGVALREIVLKPSTIGTILTGRGLTAVRTVTTNLWSIVLFALLGLLTWIRLKPGIGVWRSFADRPAVRSLVTATIATTLLALVVEDTGGSIGAYLVPLALTAVLLGVLEPDERGRRRVRRGASS
jgi:hypothetical protein